MQKAKFCIRDEQFGRRRGQNPTICTREGQCEERRGQIPAICTRAISFSGSQQAQTRCNLTCFHDVYWAVITMMGKPDSGIDRGELRSTLSLAGSCRSSANNINEERRGQKSQIRTRDLRWSGATMGPEMSDRNRNKRDRSERDGLILCFGSQETAMLCNQLLLGSLSSFSLLVPYVCIIHNRSTDEDGSVSTEADTEYQGYGKTTDRLAAEDCDSKHCHESRY